MAWNDGATNFSLATIVSPITGFNGSCRLWTDADRDGDYDMLANISMFQDYRFFTNMLRQLWLTGPSRLGGTLGLHYHAQPGQTPQPVAMFLLGSFGKIAPLQVPGLGWLQVDPTQSFLLGTAFLPAVGGDAVISIPLPNASALQGMFVGAQALDVRGGRWRLGNLVETWLGH